MKNHESVNDISKRSQRMNCIKKNCSKQIASNKMALNLKSIQKPLKIAAAAGRHHLAHGFCNIADLVQGLELRKDSCQQRFCSRSSQLLAIWAKPCHFDLLHRCYGSTQSPVT